MRRIALALVVALAALVPGGASASRYDYSWALPEWRATFSAPRLADNRGFAVRSIPGGVYVAGVTGAIGRGAGDLFLLRYTPAGALQWSRTWGGFELDQGQGIAIDDGGIWIAGSRTTDEGRIQFAVVRYSHAGDLLVERTWTRGVTDVLQSIAVDATGVYVAGLTQPTTANRNLYAARLDLTGATVWEAEWGGPGWDEAWDVAVDADGLVLAGDATADGATTSDALLMRMTRDGTLQSVTTWGGASNDEARAIAIDGDGIAITGGRQEGRSTDVFVARASRAGVIEWTQTTGGAVVGGGGYGIALGERGIYVAGGTYDFPAGGDGAVMRFSFDGELEWSQFYGLPGFWDWGFDVDARDGRFTIAGVLWRPGAEWYSVLTQQYREDFPTATLTGVADGIARGDANAAAAMDSFWPGDFMAWAERTDASDPGRSTIVWEGSSNFGRRYGKVWADTEADPIIGEDGAAEAFAGLTEDARSGNYALVRDYTGVRVSLLDGLIRFRYYISHDRLIPQGGYLYVGDLGIPLPPPPV